jgi:hypothetical protein
LGKVKYVRLINSIGAANLRDAGRQRQAHPLGGQSGANGSEREAVGHDAAKSTSGRLAQRPRRKWGEMAMCCMLMKITVLRA